MGEQQKPCVFHIILAGGKYDDDDNDVDDEDDDVDHCNCIIRDDIKLCHWFPKFPFLSLFDTKIV